MVHGRPVRPSRSGEDPYPACHPCHEFHSFPASRFGQRDICNAPHRIAVHQSRQLLLTHFLRAGRTLGQYKISKFRGTVPNANFHVLRKGEAELAENAASIDDSARSIRIRFVPSRRKTQQRPGIARAEGTNDEVVNLGSVLDHEHVVGFTCRVAELRDRLGSVLEQPFLVSGIDPRSCNHFGSVLRSDFGLISFNKQIQCCRIDQTFLNEQRFKCLRPQSRIGGNNLMIVVVIVVLLSTALFRFCHKPRCSGDRSFQKAAPSNYRFLVFRHNIGISPQPRCNKGRSSRIFFTFSKAKIVSMSFVVGFAPRTGLIKSRAFAMTSSRLIGLLKVPRTAATCSLIRLPSSMRISTVPSRWGILRSSSSSGISCPFARNRRTAGSFMRSWS